MPASASSGASVSATTIAEKPANNKIDIQKAAKIFTINDVLVMKKQNVSL
jgi:hypothetical protein